MGEPALCCRDVVDRLGDYADDDVASALRELIDKHLRACPNCRCYFAQYRLTIRLCKQIKT